MNDAKSVGLVGARADVERLHRQRGVADPGVAVVPVALAADVLGQRRGRGGDDRAGRPVGQTLEYAGAELHELPVRALVDRVLGLPGLPAGDDVVDADAHVAGRRRGRVRHLGRRPAHREAACSPSETANVAGHRGAVDLDGRTGAHDDRVRAADVRPPSAVLRNRGCTRPYSGRGAARAAARRFPRRPRRCAAARAAHPCRGRARAGPRGTRAHRSGARRRRPS